jgi:glycosyltransferase involved in cell wall biosynthesis
MKDNRAPEKRPALSAVIVAGECRRRAQQSLEALARQTVAGEMEVILVDRGPEGAAELDPGPGPRFVCLKQTRDIPWGRARAEGARAATGEVIAFIEDHCYVEPDWAEYLLEAHRGPWAAVGYSFTNANPFNYISRAGFFADYWPWAFPVPSGETHSVAGNNVSYKKETLMEFDGELNSLLTHDFTLHERLHERGLKLYTEARARTEHENYDRFTGLLMVNFYFARNLADKRALRWGWGKRIFYGLAVPLGAPTIKMIRAMRSISLRRELWPSFAAALPIILTTHLWAALGESLGYLLGEGDSNPELNFWELDVPRVSSDR